MGREGIGTHQGSTGEAERTAVKAKQKAALASGAFQPAVDETAMQAAEIRAMHCNDLDLDLPASRSEHVILRSAKLCEQLTGSNLSHPAVQNPHSTARLKSCTCNGLSIMAATY